MPETGEVRYSPSSWRHWSYRLVLINASWYSLILATSLACPTSISAANFFIFTIETPSNTPITIVPPYNNVLSKSMTTEQKVIAYGNLALQILYKLGEAWELYHDEQFEGMQQNEIDMLKSEIKKLRKEIESYKKAT